MLFRAICRSFSRASEGSVLALTGLLIPVIAGATLYAVDHVAVTNEAAALQKAADAAAIAAARELHFIQTSKLKDSTTLDAIAESYARQNMSGANLTAKATTERDTLVTVDLELTIKSPLNRIFESERILTAQATAEIYGGQNICIISAETGKINPGLSVEGQAEIRAGECGIYSNSSQPHSIRAEGSAFVDAQFICSAGGYEGGDGNFSVPVTTDCPQIRDPLDARPPPVVEACDPSLPTVIGAGESVNLTPGTYCGGLTIEGDADVWFASGIYVFRNGPLVIRGAAKAVGENVGLFFDDAESYFEFRDDAEITFSAPETGPMAGIVISARKMCANSSCISPRLFTITSANVHSLLGTINIPQDDLLIETTMPVSEEAAFTILIIDNLILRQAPSLVLNTDYSATSVPVPAGFSGRPSTRLVK